MHKRARAASALVAATVAALALAACGGGSPEPGDSATGGESGGEPITLTFWHNATQGPGTAFWEDMVAKYESSHPGVTVEITVVQNEDLDGKLQTALNSPDAPDIFLQRGGGKLHDMVDAGLLLDITDSITDEQRDKLGDAAFAAMTYQDKIWAMPDVVQPGGLFYSQDLFDQAGITKNPETLDEFFDVVKQLKDAGITPIALGGKDAWPAAHWYYWFALRECSPETITDTIAAKSFEAECWTKAGQDLADLAALEPFNDGFLTTPAQQGAGSSAGLIANHGAAMELMGAWDPGVIASLTPDEKPLPDLSWFPFPSVPDGEGAPGAVMGGMGGYSCSANAPKKECTEFLAAITTADTQVEYYKAFQVPPLNKDAKSAVTEPFNIAIMDALSDATYVSDWLDTLLGQNVGTALNTAVVDMLAGKGDPAHIVQMVNDAAAKE